MVKIGILTSSRADYGVYLPLLREFAKDPEIQFEIIAFGTHQSLMHGHTVDEIKKEFAVSLEITSILASDTEEAIATSAALTSLKFAAFWAQHTDDFDMVLCLGDRFEMFSAVIAGIPFGIKFAHFYGGDYSKGAIDNVYRDGITASSVLHFTSTQKCADRVKRMTHNHAPVDVVGILSLEEVEKLELLSIPMFQAKWQIDLSVPTCLMTMHPETVHPENNYKYASIIGEVVENLQEKYQVVISMPNADTNSQAYRDVFNQMHKKYPGRVLLVENFGIQSYFTCMKYSVVMLGNTSSGISEAASFQKYFINIGDRQAGREFGSNVISMPVDKKMILQSVEDVLKLGVYQGENIYKQNGAIDIIKNRLKSFGSESV